MAIQINGTSGISGVDGSAGTPALQGTDSNTGISFGTDTVNINTGGTTRATVDSSGRLGVGTASPSYLLDVNGIARISSYVITSQVDVATNTGIYSQSANTLQFQTNNSERARIDSSGRLLVGTSSASLGAAVIYKAGSGLQVTEPQLTVQNNIADGSAADGPGINFANASGPVVSIGSGGNGGIYIANRSSTAGSWAERMRITNNGTVLIGKTAADESTAGFHFASTNYFAATRSANPSLYVNRLTNDGSLVEFAQDTTVEGTISVSGTTVSYNGAHLSRWSQLPSGAERTEILRGSVLSNIDEMCEWGDEENEQLNRMKVSDVEGDKNVSGVFQAWDDDDDTYTNDFYCAMTGDFIIRIGAGTTVERGDLLMSAGDGTAKPQDDDIIRSKTIAKVTSTNVSCTYDDGSYCVPCVLMAC